MNYVDLSGRTRCPFYGFELYIGYSDCGGNKCTLINENSPCLMWVQYIYPDFKYCDFNTILNEGCLGNCFSYSVKPREIGSIILMWEWRDMIMDKSRTKFSRLNRLENLPISFNE